jgi:hypothetical protein
MVPSGLEETRIEMIVERPEEIQERRWLRYGVDGEFPAGAKDLVGQRCELVLEALRLVWTEQTEAHAGRGDAAQALVEEELGAVGSGDVERAQHGAEERRVVPLDGVGADGLLHAQDHRARKDAGARRREGAPLGAAGAVGHVAGEEGMAARVEACDLIGLVVPRADEGERSEPRLPQSLLAK